MNEPMKLDEAFGLVLELAEMGQRSFHYGQSLGATWTQITRYSDAIRTMQVFYLALKVDEGRQTEKLHLGGGLKWK